MRIAGRLRWQGHAAYASLDAFRSEESLRRPHANPRGPNLRRYIVSLPPRKGPLARSPIGEIRRTSRQKGRIIIIIATTGLWQSCADFAEAAQTPSRNRTGPDFDLASTTQTFAAISQFLDWEISRNFATLLIVVPNPMVA